MHDLHAVVGPRPFVDLTSIDFLTFGGPRHQLGIRSRCSSHLVFVTILLHRNPIPLRYPNGHIEPAQFTVSHRGAFRAAAILSASRPQNRKSANPSSDSSCFQMRSTSNNCMPHRAWQ